MTAGTFATQPQPPQSPTSTDGLDRAHSGNTRLSRPNTFTSNPAAGYEGDEDSSDEDEDTNRENERKKLLEDLTNDPYDYKAEEDQTYDVFKKSYQGAVEHCVLDEKDANQRTIIHYVVHKQNDKVFKEVRWRFLIRLSLEIGGSILSERSSRDRTCLHLAVDSSFIELTKCICNYARKDALSEAIKIRTLDGQTCLHMAITAPNGPFLDLVRAFMNKTHHNALEQQRKPLSNSDGEGAGNTPLHDLVSIERCKLPTRICTKPPGQCEKCKKNPPEDTAQREEKSYIKTLNQLIEKCPAAMSTLNEAQESPYQYHLSTRSKYMPSWKKLEFPQVTEDNDPSLSDNITSREKTERRLNVPVTPASLADSERRQKRPKDSRDEKSQEFTASKSGKHSRAVKQYSQSLTAKVGQILMHESLSQKDFEKACVSLFGKSM